MDSQVASGNRHVASTRRLPRRATARQRQRPRPARTGALGEPGDGHKEMVAMRRSGAEFRLWSQLGSPNRCSRRDRGARMLLPPHNCYRDAEKIRKSHTKLPSHLAFEPNLPANCTKTISPGAYITSVVCGAGARAGFGTSLGGSGFASKFPPYRSLQPELAANCTKVGNRATPGASFTSAHCGGIGVAGARSASVAAFRSSFGGSCAVWEWRVNGGIEQWPRRLHQPQGEKQRRTRTRGEASVQQKEKDAVGARGGVDLIMVSTEDVYKNLVVPSRSMGAMAVPGGAGANVGGRRWAGVQYVNSIPEEIAEVESENNVADVMNSSMRVQSQRCNTAEVDVKSILRFQSEMVPSGKNTFNPPRKLYSESRLKQRRTTSDPIQFIPRPRRQSSLKEFRNDMHHAATETYMITRLAITLLKLLGIGTRWISKLVRLGLYALFLMPGFIQVGFFYYFSKCIHRSIVYGNQPRNRFDLYLPPNGDNAKPAVIFVTGGAWIIGYKAWGSLLAQQLVERDIIVACIDYRNFPQGSVSDMVTDVSTGIGYVCQNIESFGGDPSMIYLAGQSAGAHLAACALIMQAKKEITDGPAKLSWRSSELQAYMAISGGYNLVKLVDHFNKRGLYKSLFLSVMEGEESLPLYSPEYMVMSPSFKDAVPLLPPITLFHGMADYSIPHEASKNFKVALQLIGAKVNTVFYPDKSHTDLFLQDPMRGGKDKLLHDILEIVHENDEEARQDDAMAMKRRRLVPEILLQLARLVSPF